MVSRRQLEATSKRMPGRVKVRVYSALPRDQFTRPKPLKAERRPKAISEQQGADSAGDATASEYVFYQAELDSLVLKKDDVIEDIGQAKFVSIETLSVELLGTRIRASCVPTTSPLVEIE